MGTYLGIPVAISSCMTFARWLLLPLLLIVLLLAACGSDDGGTVTPDSGATVDAGRDASSADGGKKPFGAACLVNTECETDLCFNFNMDGLHCTKPCTAATAATACAPSTFGCSGMMVCKIR
jgi:hypothetical protein